MSKFLGSEHDGLGVVTKYHKEDDKLVIEHVQDVEPYLERNKREQSAGYNDKEIPGVGRKFASIPNVLINKWLHEEGINFFDKNDWPKVMKKLLSSEYAYLRTGKY